MGIWILVRTPPCLWLRFALASGLLGIATISVIIGITVSVGTLRIIGVVFMGIKGAAGMIGIVIVGVLGILGVLGKIRVVEVIMRVGIL